jgi:hypothetical protein
MIDAGITDAAGAAGAGAVAVATTRDATKAGGRRHADPPASSLAVTAYAVLRALTDRSAVLAPGW